MELEANERRKGNDRKEVSSSRSRFSFLPPRPPTPQKSVISKSYQLANRHIFKPFRKSTPNIRREDGVLDRRADFLFSPPPSAQPTSSSPMNELELIVNSTGPPASLSGGRGLQLSPAPLALPGSPSRLLVLGSLFTPTSPLTPLPSSLRLSLAPAGQ